MICWGAFSYYGTPDLVLVLHTMNAERYIAVLESAMIPFGEQTYPTNWIFQHDNAGPHSAHLIENYRADINIDVQDQPSRIPVLNPIENLWDAHVRTVHVEFRHFDDKDELLQAMRLAWQDIDLNLLKKLVKSMSRRCIKVIEKCSGPFRH